MRGTRPNSSRSISSHEWREELSVVNCDGGITNPRRSEMAEFDSHGTFQKAADEYAKIQDAFPEVIRDPLLADMAVKEGDRILDLPCGTGDSIVKAMEQAGPTGHALAIDISA